MTTETNRKSLMSCATLAVAVFASVAPVTSTTLHAKESSGNYSPGQIAQYCNAVGGEALGNNNGAYGCESANSGVLVLCHKDQSCTVYSPDSKKSAVSQKTLKSIFESNKKGPPTP